MPATLSDLSHTGIYDHPKWYDVVYGSDWKAEYDFLLFCFEKYVPRPVTRLLEPACGTGRLLYRFAKTGYSVTGVDLNSSAIDYCNRRLVRHGCEPTAFVGDMCDFQLARPVDAAFNLVSSFRHILGHARALSHFECMARAVAPGGIYVLAFHLTPTAESPSDEEHWSATRGLLTINTSMQLRKRNWKQRIEEFDLRHDVYTPTQRHELREIIQFQMYLREEFFNLLERVPQWRVLATYDFHFDCKQPVEVDDQTEDLVLVLQRR